MAPQSNLAALIEKAHAQITIKDRAIPEPGKTDLLVRNHAIAVNPVDWKIQTYAFFVSKYPTILGSDVSGVVEKVGSDVTKFKVGDRVFGFTAGLMTGDLDRGAFQTYALVDEGATTKLPESVSFEQGATFPMAFATAAQAIFVDLGIPKEGFSQDQKQGLLVWGGASSVGTAAVQIGRELGLTVFATASPHNHELVKSLGASYVFDYRAADVAAQIAEAARSAGVSLKFGFDAASEGDTFDQTTQALTKASSSSKLAVVLAWPENKPKPAGVEISQTMAMKLTTAEKELGAWFFNEWLAERIASGKVVPAPPVQVVPGGVKATQELFDTLKKGVSAKKLVITVE